MKKIVLRGFKVLFPLALGIFLIWYSYANLSPEDIESIKNSFRDAHYQWIALAVFFAILSHVSRAYRWKYLLEPLGYKPRFPNSFMAVMIGYLVNLGIPRAGELSRAATLSKYENIPFNNVLGTVITERIIDFLILMSCIALVFVIQIDVLYDFVAERIPLGSVKTIVILMILILGAFTGISFIKKSNHAVVTKIRLFLRGLSEGIKSVAHMEKKGAFIAHTCFIWGMYLLMFYTAIFALPETSNIPFDAVITSFVVGGLSIAATNGGVGAYPLGVQQVLLLYGVDAASGLAFGWIAWTSQTLMIVVLGGLSFLFLPFYNRK